MHRDTGQDMYGHKYVRGITMSAGKGAPDNNTKTPPARRPAISFFGSRAKKKQSLQYRNKSHNTNDQKARAKINRRRAL